MPNSVLNLTQLLAGDNTSQQPLSATGNLLASADTASDGNQAPTGGFSGVLQQAVSSEGIEVPSSFPVGTGLPFGGKSLPEELETLSVTLPQDEVERPVADLDVDSATKHAQQDVALEQGVPFLQVPQELLPPLQAGFSVQMDAGQQDISVTGLATVPGTDTMPEQLAIDIEPETAFTRPFRGSLIPPASGQPHTTATQAAINETPPLPLIGDSGSVVSDMKSAYVTMPPVERVLANREGGASAPAFTATQPDSDVVLTAASKPNAAPTETAQLAGEQGSRSGVASRLSAILSSDGTVAEGREGEQPGQVVMPLSKKSGGSPSAEPAAALREEAPHGLQDHRNNPALTEARTRITDTVQLADLQSSSGKPEAVAVAGMSAAVMVRHGKTNAVRQDSPLSDTKNSGPVQTILSDTDIRPAGVAEKTLSPAMGIPVDAYQSGDKELPQTASEQLLAGGASVTEKAMAAQTEGRNSHTGVPPSFNISSAPAQPTVTASANVSAPVQHTLDMPVGHSAWEQNMARQVFQAGQNHLQSLQIRLNPANLGVLDVHITVDGDNTHVMFSSHHAVVREAVEGAIPRLREMFTTSGMNLGDVNVANHGASQEQGHDSSSGHQFFTDLAGVNDSAEVLEAVQDTAADTMATAGEQLLDYYI